MEKNIVEREEIEGIECMYIVQCTRIVRINWDKLYFNENMTYLSQIVSSKNIAKYYKSK